MTEVKEKPKRRPPLSPEQRAGRVDEQLRIELQVLLRRRHAARQEMENVDDELAAALKAAADKGVSVRDLAAVLGMPHQTVHQFVKPYERKSERAAA